MTTRRRDPAELQPIVKTLTSPKGSNYPAGRMLIASPTVIAAVLQHVPRGRVLTSSALRAALAQAYDADYTCPMTTGIFLRMAAESADVAGAGDAVPWWRVVRDDGGLNDKLPGGAAGQARRLAREGVAVSSARTPKVQDVAAIAWPVSAAARRAAKKVGAGA
jgi:hypothetical protein